jgi:isopenicillin-N N-acyltransferase-like protein
VAADNCTAFLVANERTPDGRGLVGQTWDMHHSATEHIVMLRGAPADAPAFLAFTTVGCVGMIGMNEHGVAVGINNLTAGDGRVGVTWPFAVRRILQQRTLAGALEVLRDTPLAGAHNYLLMDASGRGVNVEATPTRREETPLEGDVLVHTNHCLLSATEAVERPRDPSSTSEQRLARGRELLADGPVTPERLQAVTRDPEAICYRPSAPRFIETCGAAIMRPGSRDFWAVWGLPSENDYQRFSLSA